MSLISIYAFGFEWADSLYSAKNEAKKSNKTVILLLSQENCMACDYMKDVVFEKDEVYDYITQYFIPVEIDIYKDRVPSGFRAFGTPTIYFIDSNGTKLKDRVIGGLTYDKFLKYLQKAKNSQK
jgi:thioredoxin-related protein